MKGLVKWNDMFSEQSYLMIYESRKRLFRMKLQKCANHTLLIKTICRPEEPNWEFWLWIFHSVEILQFSCHSYFTWNQFWLISEGQNYHFDNFGGFEYWFFGKFTLENVRNIQKTENTELLKGSKVQFLGLQNNQNWFHVKSEWKKIQRQQMPGSSINFIFI